MALEKKRPGDKLSASRDWNPLIDEVTRKRRNAKPGSSTPLMGQCTEVAPIYSLFEIYDASSSFTEDEYPVVGIQKPTSALPLCLATNIEFPTVTNKPSYIELLLRGEHYKFDIDPSDTGFEIGKSCGPKNASYKLSSKGIGFICLSEPITYETSKKFVWAVLSTETGILVKTPGGGIAGATGTGPYTFGSATCTIVSDEGVVGTDTVVVKNIVSDAIAANVIGKASRRGSIFVIDVASCS